MAKQPHHTGSYHVRARNVRNAANANPHTQCWRCGQTLADIRRTYPKAKWTAGHLIPGKTNGQLAPECSHCNYSHGATLGNLRRNNKSKTRIKW